ncbi:MFS transporter [Pandoraea horticolens]|uniref:MFS transporter n=2 Tax=Pandoraea horticolens TaxID=2508298 RepID=A0A5E4YST8_9BURK|nr:MFS transporter [Pandoraea horticolens]
MGTVNIKQSDRNIWKVVTSSFLGNTLEYYDFLVYGTAASAVFPQIFFPESDGFIGTLAAFGTFAVGFLARPLGGLYFGRWGDTHGRKSALLVTLGLMGFSTLLIGLLPDYAQIGVLAPLLLVLLRLAQGFAVGGEWGGAMVIVLETAPEHRRGFFTAWPNTGGFSAQILITLIFAWVYSLPREALLSWGWRVPFMFSTLLLSVTYWMRSNLSETPVFTEFVVPSVRKAVPNANMIAATFRDDWRSLLLIVGLRFAEALPYFLLTVFALSYGANVLGIERGTLNSAMLIVSVLAFPAHGAFAAISDRIGRRPVYLFGAVVVFVTAFPFFLLLHTQLFPLIVLGYVIVLNIGHNALNAVQPALFAELFPADRRYTGAAAGREIASILAGGLTPFIATALAGPNGTHWPLVAGYVMFGATLSIIAIWKTPETFRRNLQGEATKVSANGNKGGRRTASRKASSSLRN